jgi:hypothetical protein
MNFETVSNTLKFKAFIVDNAKIDVQHIDTLSLCWSNGLSVCGGESRKLPSEVLKVKVKATCRKS